MQSDVHYTAKNDFYVEEFMELKHQCSNCEFNFDGVCAGGGLTYTEWKLNWPRTSDDCGRVQADREWRKKE